MNNNLPSELLHQPKIIERRYQRELCQLALEENVIICLGTGLGKTFIVVLYVREIEEKIRKGCKVLFLAPTQDLVGQQADYFRNHLKTYRSKVYCGRSHQGEKHIDRWDKDEWGRELSETDFMFMTPMILLNALSTNLLSWNIFAAIIFDECHHASYNKKISNHPYSQILSNYRVYFKGTPKVDRTRVIGLTASLINCRPKNRDQVGEQISKLEEDYLARCVTDFAIQDMRPRMVICPHYSTKITGKNHQLCLILSEFAERLKSIVKTRKEFLRLSRERNLSTAEQKQLRFVKWLKQAAMGFSIKPSKFPIVFEGLSMVLSRCGPWALRSLCHSIITRLDKPMIDSCALQVTKLIYSAFLDIIKQIHSSVDNYLRGITNPLHGRAKPRTLLKILKDEHRRSKENFDAKSTFSCVIFIRSRLEVVTLTEWMKAISESQSEYFFIKCDYALGLAAAQSSTYSFITKTSPSQQKRKLDAFRQGDLNVIITTAVLEEGIDLPVCSTVIRYDIPYNFREYVQSRGRARQEISSFYTICHHENIDKDKKLLNSFHDIELTLNEHLKNREIGVTLRKPNHSGRASLSNSQLEEIEDVFVTKGGLVRISGSTAFTILHMYSAYQTRKRPFSEGMTYATDVLPGRRYQVTLYWPLGCPLKGSIAGGVRQTPQSARESAVVAAIRALYEAKEIDSNCIPIRFTEKTVDTILANEGLDAKIEQLPEHLEGVKEINGTAEISLYKSKLGCTDHPLTQNYKNRKYKLLKIRYVPDPVQSRRDTCKYFESPVFGLVVDSNTSNEFVPSMLYSHYGQMRIECDTLLDNILINNLRDHEKYNEYTLNFFVKLLNFPRIRPDKFESQCLFYVVPLDKQNRIDFWKISNSLRERPRDVINANDVVKIRYEYRQLFGRSDCSMMIVKDIRRDLNARSCVPGRRGTTFLEDAHEKFGPNVVRDLRQPVIEVMPIARQFAQAKRGRQARQDYVTSNLFYLEQFLVRIEIDAASVFQAFNKPEIIYRLYLNSSASEFDEKFLKATEKCRGETIHKEPSDPPTEIIFPKHLDDGGDQLQSVGDSECMESAPYTTNYTGSQSEDEDLSSDDRESSSDSELSFDSDSSENSERLLHSEGTLDELMNQNNHQDFKRWDASKYHVSDVKSLNYELFGSWEFDSSLEEESSFFSRTIDVLQPLQDRFIALFQRFEKESSEGAGFSGEESDFLVNCLKVDRSVIPPCRFDRVSKQSDVSRHRSVLQALMLSKAQEDYNLETLENLGDSYLKYVTSVVIFKCPDLNEGVMTMARSRLTCNNYFTFLAKKSRLGAYAITQPFSKETLASILGHEARPQDRRQHLNKMRPKDLADVFESIVGSYLLYHGEYEASLAVEWLGLNIFRGDSFDERHEGAVVFSRVAPPVLPEEKMAICKARISKFEEIIGYSFNYPSYGYQAITHSTAIQNCGSYERLEFLGDAILDYLVTRTLNYLKSEFGPGQLTTSRSALVNNRAFAQLALKYNFHQFIQHSSDEMRVELCKVQSELVEDPEMTYLDMIDYDSIVKLLADVFEAVAGAIYLDSGCSLDTVWEIYYPMMKDYILREIESPTKNLVRELYEMWPGTGRVKFEFTDVDEAGVAMKAAICVIEGFDRFEGRGLSRRQAKMRAVQKALENKPQRELKEKLDSEFREKVAPPRRRPTSHSNQRSRQQFLPRNKRQSYSRSGR